MGYLRGASQSIFIPRTKAVAAYRICVSLRASSSRNSSRSRRSNVDGPTLRPACGIDGRDMGPPCVSLPLNKAGTCVDVRTEGTIGLILLPRAVARRAWLVRLNSATGLPRRADACAAVIEMAFERSSPQHKRGANEMKPRDRSRRTTWWSTRNVSLGFESVSSGWVRSRRRSINQRSVRAYRGQWRHRSSSAGRAPSVVAAVSDKIHAWQTCARSDAAH